MSPQRQSNKNAASKSAAAQERCPCLEIMDLFRTRLGVSSEVRKHLENSRVEFLKAIRVVLDERIEHLSKAGQHGTKIAVE
jgi:hypothetical protein